MSSTPEAQRAPCFFLAGPPVEGTPELLDEEREHLHVLRLAEGDRCTGLDGQGRAWPLRIARANGRRIELELAGEEPRFEPEPGAEGASLPWIEVAVAWPRRNRSEAMIGGLVQLGAASIVPLEARFRGPEPCPARPPDRWRKLAREACKQSGRAWLPVFEEAQTVEDLVGRPKGALAVLDPDGGMSFDTWLRSILPSPLGIGSRERPIRIAIGPEGGFAADERDALLLAGASSVRLGPHVLRIEVAALAAMAVAATVFARPPSVG
jgi:16S rRNA (uracil1498-N3)-methyltransferase